MALDFTETGISSLFNDGIQGISLPPEVRSEITGEPVPQASFEHSHTIGNIQCVDGRMFGYGIEFGFNSAEDLEAFLEHPQRDEIENTIKQYIESENEETLRLEMNRDESLDVYPNADHESFNDGTIGDFQVSVDEIIPQINQAYGLNIAEGQVREESFETPDIGLCSGHEPLPDNVASVLPAQGMKFGGGT